MELESPMMKHEEGDGVLFVQFKWEAVKNERSSEEHARPIFDKVLRVYITTPGNKNQVTTHEIERQFYVGEGEEPRVRERTELKRRFRRQLEAWDANNAEEMTGTPLSELPGMDAAAVATCKEMGIHTVEALAAISDTNLFMGARNWRTLAQGYLDRANGDTDLSKLTAENDELKRRLEALENQLSGQKAEEAPKKRGRPKKSEAA